MIFNFTMIFLANISVTVTSSPRNIIVVFNGQYDDSGGYNHAFNRQYGDSGYIDDFKVETVLTCHSPGFPK